MEGQNKYYCPLIEELHIGYECEHTSNMGAFVCNDQDRIVKDRLFDFELFNYINWSKEEGGLDKFIRTKFLDKSDIESLGWVHTDLQGYFVRENKKTIYKLNYYTTNNFITIDAINKKRHSFANILYPGEFYELSDVRLFTGQCKSINELRIIHKLLQIN